ncbi:phage holin, partial [Intestinibaculum porci]|uniref:phage holin n=1 Tax=Intestinibaculum porci TaxID=2487118 RepID=UPI00240936D4
LAVGILASAGILIDPTTKGASDSDRAMTYAAPSDSNLDLSVVDNPISDDNETVKFKAVEDTDEPEGNYTPSDSDADITKGK